MAGRVDRVDPVIPRRERTRTVSAELNGKTMAFLAADGVEEVEYM
jgi:hypothetical protein